MGVVKRLLHESQTLGNEFKSLDEETLYLSREDKSIMGVVKRLLYESQILGEDTLFISRQNPSPKRKVHRLSDRPPNRQPEDKQEGDRP